LGCGVPLERTSLTASTLPAESLETEDDLWTNLLGLLVGIAWTFLGAFSTCVLLLAAVVMGVVKAASSYTSVIFATLLLLGTAGGIFFVDRHANKTRHSGGHVGCLLLLIGIALLSGLALILGIVDPNGR
jgi:glucose uptake protein GlcU